MFVLWLNSSVFSRGNNGIWNIWSVWYKAIFISRVMNFYRTAFYINIFIKTTLCNVLLVCSNISDNSSFFSSRSISRFITLRLGNSKIYKKRFHRPKQSKLCRPTCMNMIRLGWNRLLILQFEPVQPLRQLMSCQRIM